MRTHTSQFKDEIKAYGRQFIDTIYHNNTTYNGDHINSINYSVDTTLLKSIMQSMVIDTDLTFSVNDKVGYGVSLVSVSNSEIKFDNFNVISIEEQKDKHSYRVTCYDNMIKTMVDYETPKINNTEITYPISVRDYINAICVHLGLTFADASNTFTNYNKMISKDYYIDDYGNSLGYTFRDVMDDLSQVVCGFIGCNSDGEIEIKTITNTQDTINEDFFNDRNVNVGKKYGPINSLVFSRTGEDNIYRDDQASITQNGLCEIKIEGNQLLSDTDRDNYIDGVFNNIDGLTFYLNDFTTKGILYYEVGDLYNVSINSVSYPCLMLSDNIKRTQGLSEIIHTDEPTTSVTDYKKADKKDIAINQTTLIVDKQNQTITSVVSKTEDIDSRVQQNNNAIINTNNNLNNVNSDLQQYKQTIATQFTQTNEDFNFQFNNITDLVNQVSNTESGHYNELHRYIRFVNGVIILGEEGNPLTAELSNNKLSFKQNGTEIAYISNNKMYIKDAQVLNNLVIGNFQFIPRNNGSLSFRKVT